MKKWQQKTHKREAKEQKHHVPAIPRASIAAIFNFLRRKRKKNLRRDLHTFRFFYYTGCRLEETCLLRASDVYDFKRNRVRNKLTIRPDTSKFRKERTIPLSQKAKDAIRNLLSLKPITPDAFLIGVGPRQIQLNLAKACKRANVSHHHPHQFRHSFATDLKNRGVSIEEIQKLLGHDDPRTTQIYLDYLTEDLNKAVNRL